MIDAAKQEGIEEGHRKGHREGRQQRDREIALALLKQSLPIKQISEATNLSVSEINALKI